VLEADHGHGPCAGEDRNGTGPRDMMRSLPGIQEKAILYSFKLGRYKAYFDSKDQSPFVNLI
jgi:hypothetical protein